LAASNRRLPGFDATFSALKSVSLLHALGSPRVRGEVAAAHDDAVDAPVGALNEWRSAGAKKKSERRRRTDRRSSNYSIVVRCAVR
jgi:hypothetical protein